jgi:cytochrome c oxidase subunit IV
MAANLEHVTSSRTYYAIYIALLCLTAATVIVASLELGHFNDVAALTIAGAKAALVVLYFMHLRHSSGLTRVFVVAGLFWLSLLLLFTLSDLVTRTLVTPAVQ